MAKKFLITNHEFRLSANVELHKELVKRGKETQGGGLWWEDEPNKKLYLYGCSMDFGFASEEDIINALKGFNTIHFIGYTVMYSQEFTINKAIVDAKEIFKIVK